MMKKLICIAILGFVLVPIQAMAEEQSSFFDGGWRISAGAVYDSGVKTDMRFKPQQRYVSPYSITPGAMTRKQAQEKGKGKTVGTRTYYEDAQGNKSWVDRNDPASGYDAGKTRYYSFAEGSYDENGAFTVGEGAFEEISSEQSAFSLTEIRDQDEGAMPGISIQLSRNLYHDEDNNWGVEAAFNFQYARRNSVYRSCSSYKIGSSTKTTGKYATKYTGKNDSTLMDLISETGGKDSFLFHDGENGPCVGQSSGISQDAAIPIDVDDFENWGGGTTQSDVQLGGYDAHADYDNMEMMLLLQPYYDITDWLSVNATLGVVVSRQSMEMSFTSFRNGLTEYSYCNDHRQWDVYGIAGLGLMMYYRGFTLSGDFLARFLDRDMDIDGAHYHGTIERGNWMFRLMLGYEF